MGTTLSDVSLHVMPSYLQPSPKIFLLLKTGPGDTFLGMLF